MRTTAVLLLVAWFAISLTVAVLLADGQPRHARSTHFLIATHTTCNLGPCSRIELVPVTGTTGRDGQLMGRRHLATVDGAVSFLWYARDGRLRYISRRPEGEWPDLEWHNDLWSMNRDGSNVRLIRRDYKLGDSELHRGVVTRHLEIPREYDTNFDHLNEMTPGEPPYVALPSPDGHLIVSRVSGIDSSRICVSDADRWDPTFRGARCFGDGFFSLPVWVAN